jgi:hypothetical protein
MHTTAQSMQLKLLLLLQVRREVVMETWCARVASRVQLLTDAVAMAAAKHSRTIQTLN